MAEDVMKNIPEDVQEEIKELYDAGSPTMMSVSSTKALAKENGLTKLVDFLNDASNKGIYVSYVMLKGMNMPK